MLFLNFNDESEDKKLHFDKYSKHSPSILLKPKFFKKYIEHNDYKLFIVNDTVFSMNNKYQIATRNIYESDMTNIYLIQNANYVSRVFETMESNTFKIIQMILNHCEFINIDNTIFIKSDDPDRYINIIINNIV